MRYDNQSIKNRKITASSIAKVVKLISFIVVIIFVYNLLLLLLSATSNSVASNVMGYESYIISTDSMEPTISVGDVVVVKKVRERTIKENDIITFHNGVEIVTHRIIGKSGDEFITKGDNNNVQDFRTVKYEDIIGKKVIIIPYMGSIIKSLSNVIYIGFICIILLTVYLYNRRIYNKKSMRRRKKKLEDEKAEKQDI